MQFQLYRWYLGIVYCFRVSMPFFPPPQNPPGRANCTRGPNSVTPTPLCQKGRQGRGSRKGYTLAVEYNRHATWEGRPYEMYIQTPWGEGPRPGGTEQGRDPSPPGREGGSGAISKGCISPGRGDSCHSCLCYPNPNQKQC